MTWNPLKKKHLTIRPTPAPQLLTSAEDRELDILVQKLIYFEEINKLMIKKVKQYYTQILALDEADRHLSTHLSECNLVHINDEFRRIVEDYYSVTSQVGKTVQDVKSLCQTTFVEPMKRFREEFAKIEASLVKREELVASWKVMYSRVQKLQEKKDRIASHIAKLELESRAEEAIAKELKIFHADLLINLASVIEKRTRFIKPCVHALIMIQLDYYGNMAKMFTHLISTQSLLDSPNTSSSKEECKQKINTEMSRIRGLTIVKHH